MISLAVIYQVLVATVPLYTTMILAYISVKWWKLFTPDQCSGINKFVTKFSVPLLSFHIISNNNLYHMNLKLILADFIQKLLALLVSGVIIKVSSRGSLDWLITGFSLATLPNTLILGIPLLKAMYGEEGTKLLSQVVVLQSAVWYSLLLFLFELRAAATDMATQPSEATEEMEAQGGTQSIDEEAKATSKVKTKLILLMVWKKLRRNPNTYACALGLIWSAICFRWNLKLPMIIDKSISILSDGGLGMAMFSLGLFMASQSRIVACGARMAALAMGLRFIVGPALMAVSSFATLMRGELLRIAIIQAALPQGIVPFVFAREYNVHPDILSTGVLFGMFIALPIALAYYILLGL